jgi:lysophospholipase L1-like esterase
LTRKNREDLLFPERVVSQLIADYSSGKLTNKRFLFRARVEDVDTYGGELEQNPPNPPNSIKARIYTNGMDVNTPVHALTVFHPFNPPHLMTPVEIGEHVFVMFEDESYSNGIWMNPVSSYGNINYSNPDERTQENRSTAQSFSESEPMSSEINEDYEYGGMSIQRETQTEIRRVASDSGSTWENKRVLVIGDSQVNAAYGKYLAQALSEKGAIVVPSGVAIGRDSWGTSSWISGIYVGDTRSAPRSAKTFSQLVQESSPDIIIISMGGNDISLSNNPPEYEEKIKQLLSATSSSQKVFWVGPPTVFERNGRPHSTTRARNRVNEILQRVLGDSYIDCRQETNDRHGRWDGVHYRNSNREHLSAWINKVVNR